MTGAVSSEHIRVLLGSLVLQTSQAFPPLNWATLLAPILRTSHGNSSKLQVTCFYFVHRSFILLDVAALKVFKSFCFRSFLARHKMA